MIFCLDRSRGECVCLRERVRKAQSFALSEVAETVFALRRTCLTCKAWRFALSEVAETAFASKRAYMTCKNDALPRVKSWRLNLS